MIPLQRYAAAVPRPWANGLGSTVELVASADGPSLLAGAPWRLSIAELRAPGPFSRLPGVHRTLMPWGAELTLDIAGAEHRAAPGETLHFDGAADTRLTALSAPAHAINLMAEGEGPTLSFTPAGSSLPADTLVVLLAACAQGDRFDLVRAAAPAALPVDAAVLAAR